MTAVKVILAGGIAAAALMTAAPATAQYYPGNPYGGYGGGNVVGQVLNQVLGGGYGAYNGYGYQQVNNQAAVGQCVNAVQARLGGGYGAYGGYGYNQYAQGGARVLGISRVEPRSNGLTVRGVATTGRNVAYGYNNSQVDLTFKCRTDYRGYVVDVDIDRARSNYGSAYTSYTPYTNDYSQYGYRRY